LTSKETESEEFAAQQIKLLENSQQGVSVVGVAFEVTLDDSIHDRSIVTDTG
jgi:ATP-dependent Lon protease